MKIWPKDWDWRSQMFFIAPMILGAWFAVVQPDLLFLIGCLALAALFHSFGVAEHHEKQIEALKAEIDALKRERAEDWHLHATVTEPPHDAIENKRSLPYLTH